MKLTSEIIEKHNIPGKKLLGVTPDYNCMLKVHVAIFNTFDLDCYGVTYKSNDTGFSYLIYTNDKLTKDAIYGIRWFVAGVVYAYDIHSFQY